MDECANLSNLDNLSDLPFYQLNDREFNFVIGSCLPDPAHMNVDLFDLIINPDKFDECDPDHIFPMPTSEYSSISTMNSSFQKAGSGALSMLHCNIRSLSKNLNLLNDMLCCLNDSPDIIAISETRLNNNSVSNIDLVNYNFFHNDSPTTAGGAGIYISKNLKTIMRPDLHLSMPLVESCWLEIDPCNNKAHIIVGCVYRHPSANIEDFTSKLDALLKNLNQKKYQIFILGDINIDFLKCNTHSLTEDYLEMLYTNNMLPVITKPTRITSHTATLIDHIYTNSFNQQTVSGIATVDISDHLPVFCISHETAVKRQMHPMTFRDYSTFNEELYKSDIRAIDWNTIQSKCTNLHELAIKTIEAVTVTADKHAPKKCISKTKQKLLKKPWITNGILKSIKTKQRMYKTHFLSNDTSKVDKYKTYSNKLNKLKSQSKALYYRKHFDLCKNNMKSTWKLIGTIIHCKTKGQSDPTKIIVNNQIYTTNSDIANQLNQYFVNVGPTIASSIRNNDDDPLKYIKSSPSSSFVLSEVTEAQVCNLFSKLNDSKTSLQIPNKLIRIVSEDLSKPFTFIYNESIKTGVVPDIFKISQVTPVYKNGLMTEPGNYRPIAVLSPFSKVLERLVHDQLYSFLEKKEILYKYQFGFRKNFSTEQAILEVTDKLKEAIDKKKISCGVFLDLSKAFDTVNHKILLSKLYAYGIRGLPLCWFESYLKHRTQYVKLGDVESSKLPILCGVPQGSTLGPLLFLLYINDLPNCCEGPSFRIFADDTNIFFISENPRELELVMNSAIKSVFSYCNSNKLSLNLKKTNYMVVTSPKKRVDINIQYIERKDHIKYLGVFIDKHLNWGAHIQHVNNKVAKNIGIINKLRHYLDLKTMKQLYYTLIFPYLNYGILSWGNNYKTRLNKLRIKQNKCMRNIFFAHSREHSTPYYNLLEILNLDNILKFKTAVFTHKILEKKDIPAIFSDFIIPAEDIHPHKTRYATQGNLHRSSIRTDYGKFMFRYKAVQVWESVPSHLKCLTEPAFRKQYKKFFLISK